MITAGIDMGMEYVKVVILKDNEIKGRGKGLSGGARRLASAEAALADALKEAGVASADLDGAVATGKGKFDIDFVDKQVTEAVAAAKAAKYLCADATCAIDAGTDETLVLTFDPEQTVAGDKIRQAVLNEKCAAGVGGFLLNMARRLEMTPEEMGAMPPAAPGGHDMNDGCVVFAELDALSLLNQGVPPGEVAAAVTDAAAVRVCNTINDITIPALDRVVLFGGLSHNKAFVAALSARSGVDFVVPEQAEYAGALGAALIAAAQS